MNNFYVLIKPWTVYVKTEALFIEQGGLDEAWGRNWIKVEAVDMDAARETGHCMRMQRMKPYSTELMNSVREQGIQNVHSFIDRLQQQHITIQDFQNTLVDERKQFVTALAELLDEAATALETPEPCRAPLPDELRGFIVMLKRLL